MDPYDIERRARRDERAKAKTKNTLTIAAIVGIGGLLVLGLYRLGTRTEPTPEHAERYADVLPWQNLKEVNGTWVGTPQSSWVGVDDPVLAEQACPAMLDRVETGPGGSVTIQHPETGAMIAECGLQQVFGSRINQPGLDARSLYQRRV
ncbi:MAG TPA: hypothetical protein QGF58_16890 [Myxococcota bacterium]|nr:hypothetical protein [Myxococcota bacterium]